MLLPVSCPRLTSLLSGGYVRSLSKFPLSRTALSNSFALGGVPCRSFFFQTDSYSLNPEAVALQIAAISRQQAFVAKFRLSLHLRSRLIDMRQFHTAILEFKSKGRKAVTAEEEDENEDDDDESAEDWQKCHDVSFAVTSPRLDIVMINGFGRKQKQIEDFLVAGKVLVNGEKPITRSMDIYVGDTIDIVLGPNERNAQQIDVNRLIIDEISSEAIQCKGNNTSSRIPINGRKWWTLTIDKAN